MKKSNKMIVTIIVILFILLLVVGGAFAYTYIATDLLKSDRQLFAKYFMQIISEDEFIDKEIKDFNEKKQQTPYETSGETTVAVVYPDNSLEAIIEKVNDLVIRHSGKVDSLNQKVEQSIEVDYGNDVTFPVSYRQNGDNFGVQIEKLSEQFIAIKNENLKDLTENLGADESIKIPNKIDFKDTNAKFELTEDEKNQLIQIYGDVLLSELTDDIFSRQKTDNSESYILELSSEKVKNVILKMLETSKENTLVIDKINEIILEQYSADEKIDASIIDDMIENINDEDISNIPNLKLTLVQSDKKLNQIILQSEESSISIVKNKTEDSLKYDINFQMTESIDETSSILQSQSESAEYNIYFNVQYNGLQDLVNVQENYELGFGGNAEGESIKYDYKISNSTQFKDSISVDELNEDTAVFLNGRGESELTKFLTNVGNKISEINKEQMTTLGLKEDENPLWCSNPITMWIFYNNINYTDEQENDIDESSKYEGVLSIKMDINLEENVNIEIPTVFSEGFSNKIYSYEYEYDTNGGTFDECKISLSAVRGYSSSDKLIEEMATYHHAIDSVKNEKINNIEWSTYNLGNTDWFSAATHNGVVYLFKYSIGEDVSGEVSEYEHYYYSVLNSITFK